MATHVYGFFDEATTALHMGLPLVAGSVLQHIKATLTHDLLSLHALFKISLLFSFNFLVLCALPFIVLSEVFHTGFSLVHVDFLLFFLCFGHLFLALELLGEQLLHVLLLLIRVHVLLVQHHVPPTLSSLILSLHIHVSIVIWRHVAC